MDSSFLKQRGGYRDLIAYQKAECIYDVTFYFANKYLNRGDRTIDQMIQAARSGKQNIVEGCSASTTSRETEIKLINVAKASLQELLIDYEDYLRVRGLSFWDKNDKKAIHTRDVCKANNNSAYYREIIQKCTDEMIANIAITLIHQADFLLERLLTNAKQEFIENGGIKEEMSRARIFYRNRNKY